MNEQIQPIGQPDETERVKEYKEYIDIRKKIQKNPLQLSSEEIRFFLNYVSERQIEEDYELAAQISKDNSSK